MKNGSNSLPNKLVDHKRTSWKDIIEYNFKKCYFLYWFILFTSTCTMRINSRHFSQRNKWYWRFVDTMKNLLQVVQWQVVKSPTGGPFTFSMMYTKKTSLAHETRNDTFQIRTQWISSLEWMHESDSEVLAIIVWIGH